MTKQEYSKKIFDLLYACYVALGKYKLLANASKEAKANAEALQQDILRVLTPNGAVPPEINDTNRASIKTLFVNTDFSSDELEDMTSKLIHEIEVFGTKHDPSTARSVVNLIGTTTGYVPELVSSRIPGFVKRAAKAVAPNTTADALSSGLTKELADLKALQTELVEHLAELNIIEHPRPEKELVKPFLINEKADSDASRLVTTVAIPHVDESFRMRFAALFEYAYCLEQIKHKLSGEARDLKAIDLVNKVQIEILKELGISHADLELVNSNDEVYKQAEQNYVDAKMPDPDCLDLEEYFRSQDRHRRNMEIMFASLSKGGAANVALLTSFKQSFEASEKNDALGRTVMRTIRYMRDQAKGVTHSFDHVLLNLPRGRTVTLDKVLSKFGIKEFIRSNFKEFSYKEHSDLVRVRAELTATKSLTAHKVTDVALPVYKFEVNLTARTDFSYDIQTYQTARLTKYARICAQQMQLAQVLVDTISTTDPKLLPNLAELRDIFNKMSDASISKKPYSEESHRRLHDALNNICTDFYPAVEQIPMHLLIQAGNIQRKFDHHMYLNDAGHILITNSPAYTYGEKYGESGTLSSAIPYATNTATGSIEFGVYSLAANVGRNATELFRGDVAAIDEDIKALNHSALVLKDTFTNDEKLAEPVVQRDKDIFAFCASLKRQSYMQRFLKFIVGIVTVIASALASRVLKFLQKKKATKTPDRYRRNLHKQLMKVQLEQQATVLMKSIQIANAMRVGETDKAINDLCKQRFGTQYNAGQLVLDDAAKAYYKVLAIQETVRSIADPILRARLAGELSIDASSPVHMTLEERQAYVDRAIKELAAYGDHLKINAFYTDCKEQFDAKIGSVLNTTDLTTHGIAARETINSLLGAPGTLEATKAIFMLSPFINHILQNLKTHFIFSLLVAAHRVQNLLHSTSMINEKSRELEIPGSVKAAAEYFVYDIGKLRFNLKCADRMIEILGHNTAEKHGAKSDIQSRSPVALFFSSILSKPTSRAAAPPPVKFAKSNPYTRSKTTLLAKLQEGCARQLVEIIESALVFEGRLGPHSKFQDTFNQLRINLAMLKSPAAVANDIVRNRILEQTLPLIAKLYENYDLQKDADVFEYLMLLRYAAENLGTLSNFSIRVHELMSYNGITDFPDDDHGNVQRVLNKLNLGNFIYNKIAEAFNDTSIYAMNAALTQVPKGVPFEIVQPASPIKKKRSWENLPSPRIPRRAKDFFKKKRI